MAKLTWAAWLIVFRKAKKKNPKLTKRQFCDKNGLNYRNAIVGFNRAKASTVKPKRKVPVKKKASKKITKKTKKDNVGNIGNAGNITDTVTDNGNDNGNEEKTDWEELELKYLEGDYPSLTAFARIVGLNPLHGNFIRHAAGWTKKKAKLRQNAHKKAIRELTRKKSFDIKNEILAATYQVIISVQEAQVQETRLFDEFNQPTAAEIKNVSEAHGNWAKVMQQLGPLVSDLKYESKTADILERVITGELDIDQAGLEFSKLGVPLPDAVKIIMAKTPVEEPETGEDHGLSYEELDKAFKEANKEIDEQESSFVPAREKEVDELKQELKDLDSFSEDNNAKKA